jgi:uncharacterized protein (TIGR03083 family)
MNDATHALGVLRASHDRLSQLVADTPDDGFEVPSACTDWTVAAVLSHLGSQAEIFSAFFDAAVNGEPVPGQESFAPIWAVWDAKSPYDQAHHSVAANEAFLVRVESLDASQLSELRFALFGMDLDAASLLRMKLTEHAIHAWDVFFAYDTDAVIPEDAASVLVDGLADMVVRAGKPASPGRKIALATSQPALRLVLDTEGVSLIPGDTSSTEALVELTSDQLIRLVYGRLSERELAGPAPVTQGVELDELRAVFPGV